MRATTGFVNVSPAIVTAFNGWCEMSLDQRALDPIELANMLDVAQGATEEIAQQEGVSVEWERLWRIEPILFDDELIGLAEEAVNEVAGKSHRPAQRTVARRGVHGPLCLTVMLFVKSLQRSQPHQGRGHAGGGHRAVGVGVAPARGQDDGSGRRADREKGEALMSEMKSFRIWPYTIVPSWTE